MQWSEFQHTAARLAKDKTEGDWRSAVSRAYYAVFHHFRQLLLSHGADIGKSGQSHFNLHSGLLHCGFAPLVDIARRIDDLRVSRTRADYELQRLVDQPWALAQVRESQNVVVDLTTIAKTLSPALIAAGAKRYLQSIGRIP
jgi:uncharacterized protein (UPF0332 family)